MTPEEIPPIVGAGTDIWTYIGASLGSLLTGGTLGALWLRRKLSTDATVIAGDRAEVDIIKTLQDDNVTLRASLKEVNAERDKLWKEMAEMSATLKIMEYQMSSIKAELVALRTDRGAST